MIHPQPAVAIYSADERNATQRGCHEILLPVSEKF